MSVGYLYVTSNDVNDVVYVGQSSQLDARNIATYLGSGDYLRRALAEIGEQHFTKRIIASFDTKVDLDYAEVLLIAELSASGVTLYNGGVGGPRTQTAFIRSMFRQFGVQPGPSMQEWYQAVKSHPREVKKLLTLGDKIPPDEFYRELESQLRLSQDLSAECPSCSAEIRTVCRTKTGNPTRNHANRGTPQPL